MEDRHNSPNPPEQQIEGLAQSINPWRRFWPRIDSAQSAIGAIRLGSFSALFLAVILSGSTTIAIVQGQTKDPWAYIDAALFAAVAFGIYRRSKLAAVTGMVLYVAEVGLAWATRGFNSLGLVFFCIIIIGFLNGVRGTFAYGRFDPHSPSPTAPMPASTKSVSIYIAAVLAALILPAPILSGIVLISHRIGVDTSDPFLGFAILASLLPGAILILILRMKPVMKVITCLLYLFVGFTSLTVYAIVLFCVALGECL